jgi:UPF0755 protein
LAYEDRTGVFTLTDAKKEDRREEDALASIFAKKNTLEQTTVMDRVQVDNRAKSPPPTPVAVSEDDDEDDSGQPFRVENTTLNKARKRRKRAHRRERLIRQHNARQSRKTFVHVLSGILLVVLIITSSAIISYNIVHISLDFTGITRNEFEIQVEIPPNATTEEVAHILYDKGIISQPGFFTLYSQLFGYDGKFLYGTFALESSMSYSAIIRTLQTVARTRETVWVTIPEGLTAEEIGLLLEENFVCLALDFEQYYKDKLNVFSFERRVNESPMKFHQLEGHLFPDTYEFFVMTALQDGAEPDSLTETQRTALESNARTAAFRMFDNFNSVITPEMYKTMHEQGFTLDELITLASMVQAEAATPHDMRYVASVFLNRLNYTDGTFLLQSDPTTYYVRDFIRPRVAPWELNMYQPLMEAYDTYQTAGLPPGPINNPGIEAIMAVLEAPSSPYYYFCANIETREVFYATNLADHEANLQRVAEAMAAGQGG